MLFPRLSQLKGGLVHSFTGTVEEMRRLVEAGLYVGINGCSLKTEENLEVVRQIPLDRIMLETDVRSRAHELEGLWLMDIWRLGTLVRDSSLARLVKVPDKGRLSAAAQAGEAGQVQEGLHGEGPE
jgi:TatD related DNase